MAIRTKMCGLTRPSDVSAAASAGAAYVGFVFFPKSPRHVDMGTARSLALQVPVGIAKVALVVNPDDALLDGITRQVPIDMIQLHGSEPPARVTEIRARTGLPVMKAVAVGSAGDLAALDRYSAVADQILVDAKPAAGGDLPGGNGVAFDWRLITGRRWSVPWMLAGGLTPDNVAQAVALTGAQQLDVSSGIEAAPGTKDPMKMIAFTQAVAAA